MTMTNFEMVINDEVWYATYQAIRSRLSKACYGGEDNQSALPDLGLHNTVSIAR